MKVGIYFDLRLPATRAEAPSRVYAHALEMAQAAEELGLDSVWYTEHHGFDDGYLPRPFTMAAAAAARTNRIRIGTAVVIAPLHSSAELAEETAVVDLVSDGRFDLGLGAGYRPTEFELFGAERSRRRQRMAEQVTEIRDLWSAGQVTPSPVQNPLPIWLGVGGPVGANRAGRLGANLLWIDPDLVPPYREGRVAAGLDPNTGRMSGPLFALPSEDPEREWATMRQHIEYQQNSYRRHMAQGSNRPMPRPYDADIGLTRPLNQPGAFWFATPEDIAERFAVTLGGTEVDTVFFWASVGGMPLNQVERNVELVARRLAPLMRNVIAELEPTPDDIPPNV